MSPLLLDSHATTAASRRRDAVVLDPDLQPIVDAERDDRLLLASILDDLDDFAGLDDTLRAFETELRALGATEAAPAVAASTAPAIAPTVVAASAMDRPAASAGAPTGEGTVVADHIAALEAHLESAFDLSSVDVPVSTASVPTATVEAADAGTVESYAALTGADEVSGTTVDGLVPLAQTPTSAMSPRAAEAKRAGRRRLMLLLAVFSGLIIVVTVAATATQRTSTVYAADSVVEASTTTTPEPTVAPTTAPPTTEPVPETTTVPVTEAPTTTAAPTTTTPVTTASTVPPTTKPPTTMAPTTLKPTTTMAPTTVANYGFLDCVRARESRGDYTAMNPSGAHGAYQMMPITARETALRAGRTDLASTPVVNWSKADQDAMAALLYQWQGAAPWGGGCSYPGA